MFIVFTGLASGFLQHKLLNNHSVALSWQRLAIAGQVTEYVVHWYPVGHTDKIQWIRVLDTTANITGKFDQMIRVKSKLAGWF